MTLVILECRRSITSGAGRSFTPRALGVFVLFFFGDFFGELPSSLFLVAFVVLTFMVFFLGFSSDMLLGGGTGTGGGTAAAAVLR